jgi:hypothetical protein
MVSVYETMSSPSNEREPTRLARLERLELEWFCLDVKSAIGWIGSRPNGI